MLTGFSESAEFQALTRAAALSYSQAAKAADQADDVFRVYQAMLDRAPNASGLEFWTGELADGTNTWMVGPKTMEAHIIPGLTSAAAAAGRPSSPGAAPEAG